MKLQHWILSAALVAIATPALAVVKVYNADAPNGIPGDAFQYSTTLCPPIQVTPGVIQGSHTLEDNGTGTVTFTNKTAVSVTDVNFDTTQLTGVFGPGAFVFVDARQTTSFTTVPVAAGSTAPLGSVAWGVISGWVNTGVGYCIASPQTLCTGGAMLPHGTTTPGSPPASPTYDLGTWSFDSVGNLEASQYITGSFNGGTSNRQNLTRGAYVGAGVPALPLVGAAVLALSLAVAGTRSVMRKK